MTDVIAKRRFAHNGRRVVGERFPVSPGAAKDLARRGLVEIVEEAPVPPVSGGVRSSASPADPLSPQTTAEPSKRGKAKKKAEPLS